LKRKGRFAVAAAELRMNVVPAEPGKNGAHAGPAGWDPQERLANFRHPENLATVREFLP